MRHNQDFRLPSELFLHSETTYCLFDASFAMQSLQQFFIALICKLAFTLVTMLHQVVSQAVEHLHTFSLVLNFLLDY